jgi:acyl dehydratase
MPSIKHFEDFTVGSSETFGNYLLTKDEIIEYATKWDPQPFHVDEEKAKETIFKGLTAAGSHLFAISCFLIMQRDIKVKVLAMLGIEELQFKLPARPDDQLSLTHECITKRESEKKNDRGIVQNRVTLKNQKNDIVLTYIDNMLIAKTIDG